MNQINIYLGVKPQSTKKLSQTWLKILITNVDLVRPVNQPQFVLTLICLNTVIQFKMLKIK